MCGRTCVVCDQLKNDRTHAHRTHVLEVFSHAHAQVRPHIARVRARTHLRNSYLEFFYHGWKDLFKGIIKRKKEIGLIMSNLE